MMDATRKPTELKPSRGSASAAVQEIFDYIEDFFVFCDAFAPQLTPLQFLVYQRFKETTKNFRHDMRIATYGSSRIGMPSL